MSHGYCASCGQFDDDLADDLCPRCCAYWAGTKSDFDADELGLDPEEPYDA